MPSAASATGPGSSVIDPRKPAPGLFPRPAAPRVEAVDARMLAAMRCVLSFTAVAIIAVDPAEPQRLVELTYTSLAAYSIYSALLALFAYRAGWPPPRRALHWIDVLFYSYLVALTAGTSSIFFYFYFFAILVASFSRGFREGLAVTLASLAAFTTVGIVFAPAGDEFELNRTLTRSVYLFVFGYLMSHLGGYEILLQRRLGLLKDINTQWNPRFGVDVLICSDLECLRRFYDADGCVMVTKGPDRRCVTYSVSARQGEGSQKVSEMTERAADALLRLPDNLSAAYHDPGGTLEMRLAGYTAYDPGRQRRSEAHLEECAGLANLLDTRAFITIPYRQANGTTGRIYVTSDRHGFPRGDFDFLAQVSAAMSTVVESVRLMNELVSRATDDERLAISRDLHDTTLQPYIGLKLALDALKREAGESNPLAPRIAELVEMAGATIRDLRAYTEGFRDRAPMPGEVLVSLVREQAARLSRFYGIEVEVRSERVEDLRGQVAAEAFHIVLGGLSNVLRHTAAKKAFVTIRRESMNLQIEIENEAGERPGGLLPFIPRTISERSQALGGTTAVEQRADGYTVVRVTLPI